MDDTNPEGCQESILRQPKLRHGKNANYTERPRTVESARHISQLMERPIEDKEDKVEPRMSYSTQGVHPPSRLRIPCWRVYLV
jgi:hypothetical protein